MAININDASVRIKKVGGANVRIVPMPGCNINDGLHKIEIRENGSWSAIVEGVHLNIASSIVNSALSRVILG